MKDSLLQIRVSSEFKQLLSKQAQNLILHHLHPDTPAVLTTRYTCPI